MNNYKQVLQKYLENDVGKVTMDILSKHTACISQTV